MKLVWLLAVYAWGGVPWAVVVVRRLRGIDVRAAGSGNVGARNSLRVGGRVAGLLVLVLDALKGGLPVLMAREVYGLGFAAVVAVVVVFGHCFSPWMIARMVRRPWPGWRHAALAVGGMGLASALGALIVLAPWIVVPVLLVGAILLLGFKRELGAPLAMIALAAPAAYWAGYSLEVVAGVAGMAGVILSKHLPDIVRLAQVGIEEPADER